MNGGLRLLVRKASMGARRRAHRDPGSAQIAPRLTALTKGLFLLPAWEKYPRIMPGGASESRQRGPARAPRLRVPGSTGPWAVVRPR